ncbi:hypothetical protein [uncultured Tateyamaria sp.]|uniref:hypothetical protein n=1 Tax=Tateyamaria sp. 1078 TaxID=3417464 RepID=UPI002629AC57|nr:hypothetical protein [uncultured Tateyamaria sp.]
MQDAQRERWLRRGSKTGDALKEVVARANGVIHPKPDMTNRALRAHPSLADQ